MRNSAVDFYQFFRKRTDAADTRLLYDLRRDFLLWDSTSYLLNPYNGMRYTFAKHSFKKKNNSKTRFHYFPHCDASFSLAIILLFI